VFVLGTQTSVSNRGIFGECMVKGYNEAYPPYVSLSLQ